MIGGHVEAEAAITETSWPNLWVLPASPDLSAVEGELASSIDKELVLRDALRRDGARASFDYVLFDTPPSFGFQTISALAAAGDVLIPVQMSGFAIRGLKEVLRTVHLVRGRLNPDLAILGIVPTFVNLRTRFSRQLLDGLCELANIRVFATVITPTVKLQETSLAGIPDHRLRVLLQGRGRVSRARRRDRRRRGGSRCLRSASARAQGVNGPPLSGPMARWLAPTSESRVERIPIDAVHDRPWWPGSDVDAATLAALRASIASRGIIEPLLLRRRGADRFEVVCGSRRLRAARDLGQTHVPAIVRELSEREALLVAAWTTVERRQHSGDRTALSERLLAAGFTPDETRVLADHPSLAAGQTAAPSNAPAFVLRARPPLPAAPIRRRHRVRAPPR